MILLRLPYAEAEADPVTAAGAVGVSAAIRGDNTEIVAVAAIRRAQPPVVRRTGAVT